MIIKKKNFNLTPGYRNKWPFSVSEVSVIAIKLNHKNIVYAIAPPDSPELFALSGILESHGFRSLVDAGIWATEFKPITTTGNVSQPVKKSLSPFFKYLEFKQVGLG